MPVEKRLAGLQRDRPLQQLTRASEIARPVVDKIDAQRPERLGIVGAQLHGALRITPGGATPLVGTIEAAEEVGHLHARHHGDGLGISGIFRKRLVRDFLGEHKVLADAIQRVDQIHRAAQLRVARPRGGRRGGFLRRLCADRLRLRNQRGDFLRTAARSENQEGDTEENNRGSDPCRCRDAATHLGRWR